MDTKIFEDCFVHESSYVDEDVEIGKGTKIWYFCHLQSGARVGNDCSLGQNVNIGNNVKIGDRCRLQNGVSVFEGVELHNDVFCGPSMVFTNDLYPRPLYTNKDDGYGKTVVEEGVSIGANATIVCGNTLGKWCTVGAGAVVTKDVKAHALVAGVPATQIGWVCKCGKKLNDSLSCGCGKSYRMTEDGLEEK